MKLDITKEGSKVTGILKGRLDTLAANDFARDLEALMDEADKHIVLDCKELAFISSSGLRLFLSLRKKTIAMGGDVTITNVSDEIRSVFTMTGFYSLFIFD